MRKQEQGSIAHDVQTLSRKKCDVCDMAKLASVVVLEMRWCRHLSGLHRDVSARLLPT